MGKEIMRHGKSKRQGMPGIQKHNEAKKEHTEALQRSEGKKSDIVVGNLQYNKALVECEGTYTQELNKMCKEKGYKPRKDATTLIDSVYGMSPEDTIFLSVFLHKDKREDTEADRTAKAKWRKEHAEWVDEYDRTPKEERMERVNKEYKREIEYAKECVKFHEKYYGKVIGAYVQFHEYTPHIHINSIPMYEDEKGVHLSAKEILGNKVKLSKMQTQFHEEVGKKYGLERGTPKENGEVKKHTTKAEWELEKVKKELTEAKGELEQTREQVIEIYKDAERLRADISAEISVRMQTMFIDRQNALKGKINRIEAKKKQIEKGIAEKYPVPILFGNVKDYAEDVKKLGKIVKEEEPMEEEDGWER